MTSRWRTQDTIPEEILDALDAHPKRPSLDLQQSIYAGHQQFPPFLKIASMTHLKALRIKIDFSYYHASWFFGLLRGLFETINSQIYHLEELELSLDLPITGNPETPGSGWNFLVPTNLTDSLIKQANDSGGGFSALRTLFIQANVSLFGMYHGKRLGLHCLMYYTYPALKELRLSFPDWKPFIDRLLKFETPIRRLHCNFTSNSRSLENRLALTTFLERCENLRAFSISATATEAVDLRPVLVALFHKHAGTLQTLVILASPNSNTIADLKELHHRLLEVHNYSLPHLSHLELQVCDSKDLENLAELTGRLRLKSLSLRSSTLDWPARENRSEDEHGCNGLLNSRDVQANHGEIFSSIMYQSNTIQDISIFNQSEYPSSAPLHIDLPTYQHGKNMTTGQVSSHNPVREMQERTLKRWARSLGEEYLTGSAQSAEAAKRKFQLALFPAYRNIIDAWEAD